MSPKAKERREARTGAGKAEVEKALKSELEGKSEREGAPSGLGGRSKWSKRPLVRRNITNKERPVAQAEQQRRRKSGAEAESFAGDCTRQRVMSTVARRAAA
jgi:hypothetical protein